MRSVNIYVYIKLVAGIQKHHQADGQNSVLNWEISTPRSRQCVYETESRCSLAACVELL